MPWIAPRQFPTVKLMGQVAQVVGQGVQFEVEGGFLGFVLMLFRLVLMLLGLMIMSLSFMLLSFVLMVMVMLLELLALVLLIADNHLQPTVWQVQRVVPHQFIVVNILVGEPLAIAVSAPTVFMGQFSCQFIALSLDDAGCLSVGRECEMGVPPTVCSVPASGVLLFP